MYIYHQKINNCLSIIIPTEKEIAIMYALPKIINSNVIQKDMPELYDLGLKYLKEELQNNK
jgi:hypothetical protein